MTPEMRRIYVGMQRLARRFGAHGSFTGVHKTVGSPSVLAVTSVIPAQTLYFLPVRVESFSTTFPEVQIWQTTWIVFGDLGVNLESQDIVTNGALAYRIAAAPVAHYGFVLGPAQVDTLPDAPQTGDGWNL